MQKTASISSTTQYELTTFVIQRSTLCGSAWKIGVIAARRYDAALKYGYPSLNELSLKSRLSKSTVKLAILELIKSKEWSVEKGGRVGAKNQANRYRPNREAISSYTPPAVSWTPQDAAHEVRSGRLSQYVLTNLVIDRSVLNGAAWKIGVVLSTLYYQDKGCAFITRKELEERTNLNHDTVGRALREIEKSGEWTTIKDGRRGVHNGANYYYPHITLLQAYRPGFNNKEYQYN